MVTKLDFGNVFNHAFENYKKIALYAGLMIFVFFVMVRIIDWWNSNFYFWSFRTKSKNVRKFKNRKFYRTAFGNICNSGNII